MEYPSDVAYRAEPRTEQGYDEEYQLHPLDDALSYFREYARERPDVVALACFGIGFVLGWKLKPW
jgi:hypothetical protein